jgi:hypothetical protein
MSAIPGRLAPYRERGTIPCASASAIARECGVAASAVRDVADDMGIRVSECQLGLFGYEAYGEKRWVRPLASVPRSLEVGIRAACREDRLPCADAWGLADASGLPRLLMGSIVETIGVRIVSCQLGCFE